MHRIMPAVAAAGVLILGTILVGCGSKPREKSELEKNFAQVSTGQTMEEVVQLLGEPTSRITEIEEEEDFFESDDGTMKVPRGSTIHVWSYDEEPRSYVVWFADNNDASDPMNVVYMNLSISVGRSVQIK